MKNLKRIATFKNFVGELKATYKRTELPTVTVRSSKDAAEFIRPYFEECMDDHEEVKIIHLSRANTIVNVDHHASGNESGCTVSIKMILQKAILIKTEALIFVHNHPSGSLKASTADIQLTNRLKEACKLLDLSLLDSLILTRETYYSLADNGLIN